MLIEYETIIKRLKDIEQQLRMFVEGSESGRILLGISGIGIINASALLASIDKGQAFNSPKEFAVWLGQRPNNMPRVISARWAVLPNEETVTYVNK
jgi:transposase